MKKTRIHPMEAIHHINKRFNAVFSWPLYVVWMAITSVLYVSPYSVRLFLAFGVNLFFNRPAVYLSYFGKYVGQKMNFLMFLLFYLVVFWAYAFFHAVFQPFRKNGGDSTWKKNGEGPSQESYFHQS